MPNPDPGNAPGRKKRRLKFGIIESFLLIFLLVVGVGYLFDNNRKINSDQQEAEKLFLQSSKRVQCELERIQDAATLILHSAQAYYEAGILAAGNIQAANTIFTTYLQQYPFITSINSGDGAGNGYLLLRTDKENKNRIKRAKEEGSVTWLTLNEQGRIIASERVKDDYDPRTRPWYQNSINYKEIVWSSPYQFRTTGDIGITASLWLGNKDGRDEVVGIDIMLKDLSRFLATLSVGKGATTYLIDVDGTMIASSDLSGLASLLQQQKTDLPRVGSNDFPLIDRALNSNQEEDSFWSFTFAGQNFFALMEPVSFTPKGKFKLLITVPTESFSGDFLSATLWQMATLILLLSIAITWYINRFLLPLRKINSAIKEFGAGKVVTLPVAATRTDEIGELAANFTEMRETLRQRGELLRESEERLQLIGDNLPESYIYQYQYAADGTMQFLYISAGVVSLHGLSRESVLCNSATLLRQLDKEMLPTLIAAEKSSLQTMTDFKATTSFSRSDGERRSLLVRSRPRRRADGQLIWDGVATDITDRRQMQDAIQEQKEFTEKLLDNSAVATFVLDAQHKVLLWNKACEELTGLTSAAMVGSSESWRAFYDEPRPTLADVVLDADFERLPELYAVAAKSTLTNNGIHAERWYQNLHGKDRYISFDAAPVYGSGGTLLAVIETIQELTELKLADAALLDHTKRLSTILDGINALIYVADLETYEILFINKFGREIWGEVAGETCWKVLQSGQSGPCSFCSNDRLLNADGAPTGIYAWEFQNTVTDRWYDCRDQVIRWSDGRLVRMEIATDITGRKEGEATLLLQGAALNAAANAIVITDRTGRIEWANPAFRILTGYSTEEAIGKNPRDLVKSGVHDQAFYREIWDSLLAGNVWRGEMTNRHKDGTLYPEGQTITPVKDARGEITHFIAIKRDLTRRHKLEEQLQHAQKMESIGTLAGGVAHDFNNILTAIIGYGTIALMKMATDDPHRLYIKNMLEASDRAAHLTKDLLLFSRKQRVIKKPVDLNMVADKAEKFLARVIGEDIVFKTILQETPVPILADAYQLEQVLMNLATNARDAMPHGGALTLTTGKVVLNEEFVSVHGCGKPGVYGLITVTDTGCGMNDATRLRIFEPFFTTKEVGKGTGLGLAMAYGIIKQHDGCLHVDSQPGTGTTFRIYLPLYSAAREGRAQPEEVSVGGTETILLAEDDKSVRAMTMSLLTEFGYTVIEAVNGADAVNKFTEYRNPIDLLLFDLIMPKMNGKEALDEIRKIRPGIKAIFSSGYAPDTIRQKTSMADGVHLISKPAPPAELLRKVRQVLDSSSQPDSAFGTTKDSPC
ncbi:MAG: hypothetical protein CVU69_11295 [Deltaproteobacteria bacterium HGW-Deltaproteobacteria-4]|nr:MAG: hypothetical protein CVU69_11295 [Deltaproteobacteria bacterium HGW-Deltaproteobacteria-4]